MSDISGQKIAELFLSLKVNMSFWGKLHLEQVFSSNGKGEEGKLTIHQYYFLLCIRNLGINTISELSNSFCISKSSASLSIAKMTAKGYLTKENPSKEDDGRKIYIHLTNKGLAALESAERNLMDISSQYFDSFDDEAKYTLCTHLTTINQLLLAGGTKK